MKNIAVLYSEYTPLVDVLSLKFKDEKVCCFAQIPSNLDDFNLIIDLGLNVTHNSNVLKSHYSLLPAFADKEPVKDAILAGVKVTGITILFQDKILAQYPVFIEPDKHYDELLQELKYLEQVILPIVAEKILLNEPVNLKNILSGNGCSGSCGGCSKCRN